MAGDIDIVIGNGKYARWDGLKLLLNHGNGSFGEPIVLLGQVGQQADESNQVLALELADFDGDGHVDIVVGKGNLEGLANQVLLNSGQGDGTFDEPIDLPGGSWRTHTLAVADFDGDGDVDIVVGNIGDSIPSQLLLNKVVHTDGNHAPGTFADAIELPGSIVQVSALAVADFDGDGHVDIAVGRGRGPGAAARTSGYC